MIPAECRQRGHVMRLISENPRVMACAREGCPERHTVEVKTVAISTELAHLLNCPHHAPDVREAAWREIQRLGQEAPSKEEILDAAVEDLAGEPTLRLIEGFANGTTVPDGGDAG